MGPVKSLAVHSVKGGVGKSTLAVNLAVGFAQKGMCVGLLDADITGPSVAQMLGNEHTPLDRAGEAHGIRFASLGGLAGPDQPLIHNGALVDRRIRGFLDQIQWGPLDLLVVDLPPGSGDAVLAVAARLNLDGVAVVTSPQELSLNDTIRGLHALGELKAPVLGLIENMGRFHCPSCGSNSRPFGESVTQSLCESLELPLLAQLPLDPAVMEASDDGVPIILNPQAVIASQLTHLVDNLQQLLCAEKEPV